MVTKILLADDSIVIQKVAQLTFAETEYQVTTVGDGEAAFKKIKEINPNIVLLDAVMPKLNGYELSAKLKSDPQTRLIPIILITASFEAFDETRAKEIGIEDFITKPFNSSELIGRVNAIISRSQTGKQPPPLRKTEQEEVMPLEEISEEFIDPATMESSPQANIDETDADPFDDPFDDSVSISEEESETSHQETSAIDKQENTEDRDSFFPENKSEPDLPEIPVSDELSHEETEEPMHLEAVLEESQEKSSPEDYPSDEYFTPEEDLETTESSELSEEFESPTAPSLKEPAEEPFVFSEIGDDAGEKSETLEDSDASTPTSFFEEDGTTEPTSFSEEQTTPKTIKIAEKTTTAKQIHIREEPGTFNPVHGDNVSTLPGKPHIAEEQVVSKPLPVTKEHEAKTEEKIAKIVTQGEFAVFFPKEIPCQYPTYLLIEWKTKSSTAMHKSEGMEIKIEHEGFIVEGDFARNMWIPTEPGTISNSLFRIIPMNVGVGEFHIEVLYHGKIITTIPVLCDVKPLLSDISYMKSMNPKTINLKEN